MAFLNFQYGLQSNLPSFTDAKAGTVYVTTDKSELFVKLPDQTDFVNLGDFQLVEYTEGTAENALKALPDSLKRKNILYVAVNGTTTGMYRYDGTEFLAINKTSEMTEVINRVDALDEWKTTTDTTLTNIQDSINDINNNQLPQKAPNNHASADTTYGVGTNELYGHVKLSDSTVASAGAALDGGVAATPTAVAAGVTEAKTYTDEQISNFYVNHPLNIGALVNDEGVLYFAVTEAPGLVTVASEADLPADAKEGTIAIVGA